MFQPLVEYIAVEQRRKNSVRQMCRASFRNSMSTCLFVYGVSLSIELSAYRSN